MAIYAIGDIQGCLRPFQNLLKQINFDPAEDRLWLTGDLVNRGPDSLETLRYVRDLGDSVITVLGNHDLHLLAISSQAQHAARSNDGLNEILQAEDSKDLLDWLRGRPLAHFDEGLNTLLVHAGVDPSWDSKSTLKYAKEVEAMLRSDSSDISSEDFFTHMYDDQPDRWSDSLVGIARTRFIVNCLTRARMITPDGHFEFSYKGTLESAPPHLIPWFRAPSAQWQTSRIVFGHWSALGLLLEPRLMAIDTGCVWGRQLTAVRLDGEPDLTQVRCSIDCEQEASHEH